MVSTVHTPYSDAQIAVWLRGLLTIAWADGHFDQEEQQVIAALTQELASNTDLGPIETISPAELVDSLGQEVSVAEDFMRTAVMVAIADGLYSAPEDEVLHEFCTALKLDSKILESLRHTLNYLPAEGYLPAETQINTSSVVSAAEIERHLEVLKPMQEWLDHLEVKDPRLARFLCKMIPPQCPFERDVVLFGRKLVHIPPMCKLNPLYDQLVGLRFRALSYLADDCKEDITRYC
jgi:tellurite resistance protein